MSFAELKEQVVALSAEDRLRLSAFLADLDQESEPEFRRQVDKRMQSMDAGRKMNADEFEQRDRKLRDDGR